MAGRKRVDSELSFDEDFGEAAGLRPKQPMTAPPPALQHVPDADLREISLDTPSAERAEKAAVAAKEAQQQAHARAVARATGEGLPGGLFPDTPKGPAPSDNASEVPHMALDKFLAPVPAPSPRLMSSPPAGRGRPSVTPGSGVAHDPGELATARSSVVPPPAPVFTSPGGK